MYIHIQNIKKTITTLTSRLRRLAIPPLPVSSRGWAGLAANSAHISPSPSPATGGPAQFPLGGPPLPLSPLRPQELGPDAGEQPSCLAPTFPPRQAAAAACPCAPPRCSSYARPPLATLPPASRGHTRSRLPPSDHARSCIGPRVQPPPSPRVAATSTPANLPQREWSRWRQDLDGKAAE